MKFALKSCPFCGAEAEVVSMPMGILRTMGSAVRCTGCGVRTDVYLDQWKAVTQWELRQTCSRVAPILPPYTLTNEHAEWIRQCLRQSTSALGEKVATILGEAFGGIYHIDSRSLKEADWSDQHYIVVNLRHRSLATFDIGHLTALVILAHDQCVRMDLSARSRGILELMFHPREGREGRISTRHWTIEQAIAAIRGKAEVTSVGVNENE